MKKSIFLLIICLGAGSVTRAQLYSKGERYKAGIKAGIAVNSLGGQALSPLVKGGFHAGLYYRQQSKSNKKNHWLLDGAVAFRGARYDYGIERLDRINVVMVELPVSFMHTISRSEERAVNVFTGAGPAFLIQSEAYMDAEIVPRQTRLPMNWLNAVGVAGMHLDTYYLGIQLAFKVNPRNLLNGEEFGNQIRPQPDFSASLMPWTVELGIYF